MLSADEIIKHYSLEKHPEGGYYSRSYTSPLLLDQSIIGASFSGPRHALTSIFYLLKNGEKSFFHKIASDEIWYFHLGGALKIVEITPEARFSETLLGSEILKNNVFQYCVKAGNYFAASPDIDSEYSFVSCVVCPGFDFKEFEMPGREVLLNKYPGLKDYIHFYTKQD